MFTIRCGTLSAHGVIYDVEDERCLYHCFDRNKSGVDSPCRFVIFEKVFTGESGFGLRQYLRQAARLDDVSESTFRQLRNKKMEAEAEIAALKLALYQRKLHRTEDVEFLMTTMLTAVKSRLLAIPSRTSRLVLGKTGFQEVYSLLYSEIEQVLRTLSAYNPSDFAEQNEEYLARK